MGEEEGNTSTSIESAIINYLNTKRRIQMMKQQIEAASSSLQQQRKRTNGNYWKMCAFNAVSCFG
jgi:ribosomal protein L16/L10AE